MKQKRRKRRSRLNNLFTLSLWQVVMSLVFLILAGPLNAQCTARSLPYLEPFSANSMSVCTLATGGWVGSTTASQAGWDLPSTNYAGGTAPEIEAYGNQSNGGVSETLTLVSPPIKTLGLSSVNLSFKHALNLTNSGTSGSNAISIAVSWSSDNSTWTSLYNNTYNATASLTTVVTETRTLTVSGLSSDSIFLRFSISGVLFKVWGWEIDDVSLSSNTTAIASSFVPQLLAFPNPANNKLIVKYRATGRSTKLTMTNALGKIVYNKEVEGSEHSMDVSGYPRGLYLLHLQDTDGITTRKITLE